MNPALFLLLFRGGSSTVVVVDVGLGVVEAIQFYTPDADVAQLYPPGAITAQLYPPGAEVAQGGR